MSDLRPRSRRAAAARVSGIARHGRLRKSSPWPALFKFLGAALVVVLVSAASVSGIVLNNISAKIQSNSIQLPSETEGPIPQIGAIKGGFNILVVGSDQCEQWDGCAGPATVVRASSMT